VLDCIRVLNDPESAARVTAERAINARLHGSCQVPVAGYAVLENGEIFLRALVGDPSGERIVRGAIRGPVGEAQRLGEALAEDLLARGAGVILRNVLNAAS
jgi:hydroxymethylbilane synthase